MTDPLLAERFRLDGVITTVDATVGAATLDRHSESVKQAAVADRLLLTKSDLADAAARAALEARLRALNPAAPIHPVTQGEIEPALQIGRASCRGKSVSVRVDLGGRRIINKKNQSLNTQSVTSAENY